MEKRLLFILALIFVAASSTAAQNRTITNEDLEKYRQKRLTAERDLRENYERLGFPSPEELDRQIEQSNKERSELAARLRAENYEREQLNLERQRVEREARIQAAQLQNQNNQRGDDYFYNSPFTGGFITFPNYGYRNYPYNRGVYGSGYRRDYGSQPRIEYRNNLPVLLPPTPPRILAPRSTDGGRRH